MKMGIGYWLRAAVVGSALCGFKLLVPAPAAACSSEAPDPELTRGVPVDGATDVPTDVVPMFAVPVSVLIALGSDVTTDLDAPVPGTFRLQTVDGVEVALETRRVHHEYFELVPSHILAAHTEHVIEGSWTIAGETFTDAMTFTTGAGPLGAAPPPPLARLLNYRAANEDQVSSCSPPSRGTCVYDEAGSFLEVSHGFEDGPQSDWFVAREAIVLSLDVEGTGLAYPCASVRTRALNGLRSEPATVCASGETVHVIDSTEISCTANGLAWPDVQRRNQLTLGTTVLPTRIPSDAPAPAQPASPTAPTQPTQLTSPALEAPSTAGEPAASDAGGEPARYACNALPPAPSAQLLPASLLALLAAFALWRARA